MGKYPVFRIIYSGKNIGEKHERNETFLSLVRIPLF